MQSRIQVETELAGQRNMVQKLELQEQKRLEILLDIHQSILGTQNLSATAQLALRHLQSIVPEYQAGSVLLFKPAVEVLALDLRGVETPWPEEPLLIRSDLAIDLECLEQGKPYLIKDLSKLTMLLPIQSAMVSQGIRSYLATPLRIRSELVGILNLASGIVDGFSTDLIMIIREVGDSLAVAVQQSRLLEAEQKRRREAEMMRDVMAALASSVNINQVLEVIFRNLGKVIRYDRAALYMQNENARFQFPAGDPIRSSQLPNFFPEDDLIIAELRNKRAPLVIADIQQDDRFAGWPERDLVRGWIGIPLFAGDDMIGIVSLGDLEPDAYHAYDTGLLQMFTDQVADVLVRARLQENASRRTDELELLTAFSLAMRQAEGQENILAALMEQATHVFGANRGTFLLLEQDASTLVISFSQDIELVGHWHPHGNDPLWQVARSGDAIFIQDLAGASDQFPSKLYQLLFEDMCSAALLPLKTFDTIFGILCFTFKQRQEFSLEDQRLFHAISEIAGTALRRAATLESLEKQVSTRTRHLSTLYEISAIASEPMILETLLERMLLITLEVMECPAGAIHLLSEDHKNLRIAAQFSLPDEILVEFSSLPVSELFWRDLLQSREPVVIPNLKTDLRTPPELKNVHYPAFLTAPIRTKGQSLGSLSLLAESIMEYTIEDVTLVATIAEQVGSAVERARLQKQAERTAVAEERQRLARELHDSISQLLYSLVLYAGASRKVLRHGDLETTADYLKRIDQTSQQALKEMRLMVYELRPSVFREEGLIGALNRRLQAVEQRTGMNAQLFVEGEIDLDEGVELALYRITEEALNNTLKHSEATQVVVRLSFKTGRLGLEIRDNGKGFSLQDGRAAGGLGLIGIEERVNHLGGKLEVDTQPGEGTIIHVQLEVPG